MDTKIRLTRKPLTTALWTILVAAMALLLSVGAAMMYSSGSLAGILDGYHTSIAVRLNPATPDHDGFTRADAERFEAMDAVEKVYFHTVSAGVCPKLTPVLAPSFDHDSNECYSDVLMVGTITVLEFEDDGTSVRGSFHIEETILENPTITRSFAREEPVMEFWYSGWDSSLDHLQVGQRWVFFGSYMDIFGVHSVSYPGHWQDGKLLRVENWKYPPDEDDELITGPALLAPIEGTWEEFIADPDNAIYLDMIDRWERQQHSLPVLGTDNVSALHSFATSKASVSQGRSFTEEEYTSGAKVCLISESVANGSGISVGDTITMEQYLLTDAHEVNPNLNGSLSWDVDGMNNEPNVGLLTMLPEFAAQEEFTVVGLYRQMDEWGNGPYAFTPNTIIIPKSAQIAGAMGGPTGEQNYIIVDGTYGPYFSIHLKNGRISEFEEQMDEDERFAGQFLIVDQGFGAVMERLAQISGSTMKLMAIAGLGWLLLLALFVLLYQGAQRKNLGIMRSLGASPKTAGDYLWKSGLTVAAVGIAIGTAVSLAVIRVVQSRLLENAVAELPSKYSLGALSDDAVRVMTQESQLPIWLLLLLAAAQIVLFALALRLQARNVARKNPRNLLSM